jgi:hypothetical protein
LLSKSDVNKGTPYIKHGVLVNSLVSRDFFQDLLCVEVFVLEVEVDGDTLSRKEGDGQHGHVWAKEKFVVATDSPRLLQTLPNEKCDDCCSK